VSAERLQSQRNQASILSSAPGAEERRSPPPEVEKDLALRPVDKHTNDISFTATARRTCPSKKTEDEERRKKAGAHSERCQQPKGRGPREKRKADGPSQTRRGLYLESCRGERSGRDVVDIFAKLEGKKKERKNGEAWNDETLIRLNRCELESSSLSGQR